MTNTNAENNTNTDKNFTRADGRATNELRPVRITRGFTSNPAGSVLVEFGNTRVMCTASVEEGVPRFKNCLLYTSPSPRDRG